MARFGERLDLRLTEREKSQITTRFLGWLAGRMVVIICRSRGSVLDICTSMDLSRVEM